MLSLALLLLVGSEARAEPLTQVGKHVLARAIHAWAATEACAYRVEWLVDDRTETFEVVPTSDGGSIWRSSKREEESGDTPDSVPTGLAGAWQFPGDGLGFLLSAGLMSAESAHPSDKTSRPSAVPEYHAFDALRSKDRELLLAVAVPPEVMEGMGRHLRVSMSIAGFPAGIQLISFVGVELPFSPRRSIRIDQYRRVMELDFDSEVQGTVIRRDTLDLGGWSEDWGEFTVLGTYIYTDFDCSRRAPLNSAQQYSFPVPSVFDSLEIPHDFLIE